MGRTIACVCFLTLVDACSPDAPPLPAVCAAGSTQVCTCPTGGPGVQVCASSGLRWDECACTFDNDGGAHDDAVLPLLPDSGTDCASPAVICGGNCVDTTSDARNCGACGHACDPSHICRSSMCILVCSGGQTACGSSCANTASDPGNCGACGTACGGGQSCIAGSCVTPCPAGRVECGGACVATGSDPANCGACGTTCTPAQTCSSGACVSSSPPVSVSWTYPGLFTNTGTTEIWFPTYLTNLFDPAPAPMVPIHFDLMCASLVNDTAIAQSVTLSVRFPIYATDESVMVTVPSMGTAQRCLDPSFMSAALFGLRATTPGSVQVSASSGGMTISTATRPFSILAGNAVAWTPQTPATTMDMDRLTAVFIEPNNTDVLSLRSDAERLSTFPGGFGTSPFSHPPRNYAATVPAGNHMASSLFFMESGESVTVNIQSVSGGNANTVTMLVMNSSQYMTCAGGGSCYGEVTLLGAGTGSMRTDAATTDDWRYLAFFNNGSIPADVSWTRSQTYWDVAFDALQAVFLAVRARGVSYSNIAIGDIAGLQYIRRPSDVLAMGAGNCIEGTLLFASVLENIGMTPWLEYLHCPDIGHAIVGVSVPGSHQVWPIETTMVGSAATPGQAHTTSLSELFAHASCTDRQSVGAARAANIRPMM